MLLTRRTLAVAALAVPFAARAQVVAPYIVGGMSAVPILDGLFPLSLDMIPDAKNAEGEALLAAAGRPASGPDPLPVNGFVIRRADQITLIDSGAGGLFGPGLGALPRKLEEAKIFPGAVTTIVVTHLHGDHVGGMLTADGTARFTNAELVLQESEAAFWSDDGAMSRGSADMQSFFKIARMALAAYRGRIRLVNGAADLAPGLVAMPLPGHTPGHMGVMLTDGSERMLMWTDTIHSAALQLPNPAWTVVFDADPAQAAATRARVLDVVAADRLRVAGSHMATAGRIERRAKGYALIG